MVSDRLAPDLASEHVVPLPLCNDCRQRPQKSSETASQFEEHMLPNGHFLVLERDSYLGHG